MCFIKLIIVCGIASSIGGSQETQFTTPTPSQTTAKSQLLIKKGAKDNNGHINFEEHLIPSGIEFIPFLVESQVVIDKSLFIYNVVEEFAEGGGNFIITAPSRWGKTNLLKMLSFYFTPEVNNASTFTLNEQKSTNAFNYFKSGKIAIDGVEYEFEETPLLYKESSNINTDILDQYLAQHPVLFLDFTNIYTEGDDINMVKDNLRYIVETAYDRHSKVLYLYCFQQEQKDIPPEIHTSCFGLKRFLNGNLDPQIAIGKLLVLLYYRYNKKVVVLVDEYEKLPTALYMIGKQRKLSTQHFSEIIEYYKSVMLILCKLNPDKKLFVILTGLLPVSFHGMSGFTVVPRSFLHPTFSPFFGIDNTTAISLMDLAGIEDDKKRNIMIVCNNYENHNIPESKIYNPFSLLQFIHKSMDDYPWFEYSKTIYLKIAVIPNNKYARSDLLQLIGRKCFDYDDRGKQLLHIAMLPQMSLDINSWHESKVKDTFLAYLLHMGLATLTTKAKYERTQLKCLLNNQEDGDKEISKSVDTNSRQANNQLCVKIPNLENALIIEYGLNIHSYKYMNIFQMVECLATILYDPNAKLENFRNHIELYLREERNTQYLEYGSELYYHAVIYCDIIDSLSIRYNYKCRLDFRLVDDDAATPDIVIHNGTHGAIFEIKYNIIPSKEREAIDIQVPHYGLLFHKAYPKVEYVRLILIHIKRKKLKKKKLEHVKNKEHPEITLNVIMKEVKTITCEDDFNTLQQTYDYNTNKDKTSKAAQGISPSLGEKST